jgi:hypothetical protein
MVNPHITGNSRQWRTLSDCTGARNVPGVGEKSYGKGQMGFTPFELWLSLAPIFLPIIAPPHVAAGLYACGRNAYRGRCISQVFTPAGDTRIVAGASRRSLRLREKRIS